MWRISATCLNGQKGNPIGDGPFPFSYFILFYLALYNTGAQLCANTTCSSLSHAIGNWVGVFWLAVLGIALEMLLQKETPAGRVRVCFAGVSKAYRSRLSAVSVFPHSYFWHGTMIRVFPLVARAD